MNFIYFSTLAWDEAGGAHNPTQMTRALARLGHSVLFVEPQPSMTRDTQRLPINIVALTELGMSPTQLRRAWYGLDSGELNEVAQNLMQRVHTGNDPRVAIFSAPFDPFVRLIPLLRAQNFSIAYYAMDDFAAAPALGYTQFVAGAEEFLTRSSDVLCAVTPHIAQSLERFGKRAHIIPNGVDANAWRVAANRSDALNIPRGELALGFWGTLMESMFDAELIAHIAQARPRWTIHLLGALDPESHRPSIAARLKKFPNIFFHGAIAHADLPLYAAAFDVCLAPFPDNAFTRGRDPIKVYEYLAAHRPVAASYTPQLAALPYTFVAQSAQEFIGAIEHAARAQMDSRALDEFLAQQTWDTRADALLKILCENKNSKTGIENEILHTFANPDTDAVMRYARALEQELEQVQAWAHELERNAQTRGMWARIKRRANL